MHSHTPLHSLSLLGVVNALGSVTVVNKCPFPVNLWSVSQEQGPQIVLSQGGGTYTQTYQTSPGGGGVSIKITTADYITDPITQLEYTVGTGSYDNLVWYDLSNIDGMPFQQYGVTLQPSDPTCAPVICAENDSSCADNVFNQPDDTFAIHACSTEASLVFTLCTGDGTPPSVSSSADPTTLATTTSMTLATPSSSPPVTTSATTLTGLSSYPADTNSYLTSVATAACPTATMWMTSVLPPSPEITITRTTIITHHVTVETSVYQTVTAAANARRVRRSRRRS